MYRFCILSIYISIYRSICLSVYLNYLSYLCYRSYPSYPSYLSYLCYLSIYMSVYLCIYLNILSYLILSCPILSYPNHPSICAYAVHVTTCSCFASLSPGTIAVPHNGSSQNFATVLPVVLDRPPNLKVGLSKNCRYLNMAVLDKRTWNLNGCANNGAAVG